jgi:integrase
MGYSLLVFLHVTVIDLFWVLSHETDSTATPDHTFQQLLGHRDIRTTMIYTHTVQSRTVKETGSPLDFTPEQISLVD